MTWKSSHLKMILQQHIQQWTNHHSGVQYVCVYVCVSECRCACVCGDSLSCTLTATASAGAVSTHSLYHVGRQHGWACVCVCVHVWTVLHSRETALHLTRLIFWLDRGIERDRCKHKLMMIEGWKNKLTVNPFLYISPSLCIILFPLLIIFAPILHTSAGPL